MTVEIVPMTEWYHLEHSLHLARQTLDPKAYTDIHSLRNELCHPDAQYYVALVHGGVKGFAGWKKSGINRHVFEFPWCVVHPEYRGQGIGRLLIEHRIADVTRHGGRAIIITTPTPKLYIKFGFRTIEVLPGLWANHLMLLVL